MKDTKCKTINEKRIQRTILTVFLLLSLGTVLSASISETQQKARKAVYKAIGDKRITSAEMSEYIAKINKGDEDALKVLVLLSAEEEARKAGVPEVKIAYRRSSAGRRSRTAVWIEDSKGNLIKTLYRSVGGVINPFPVRLLNWERKSGKISDNQPDAYTGATIDGGAFDTAYTFIWDCKDMKGKAVPDGEYIYKVENARYYAPPFRPQSNISSGKIKIGGAPEKSLGSIDTTPPALLTSLTAEFYLKKPGETNNTTNTSGNDDTYE